MSQSRIMWNTGDHDIVTNFQIQCWTQIFIRMIHLPYSQTHLLCHKIYKQQISTKTIQALNYFTLHPNFAFKIVTVPKKAITVAMFGLKHLILKQDCLILIIGLVYKHSLSINSYRVISKYCRVLQDHCDNLVAPHSTFVWVMLCEHFFLSDVGVYGSHTCQL